MHLLEGLVGGADRIGGQGRHLREHVGVTRSDLGRWDDLVIARLGLRRLSGLARARVVIGATRGDEREAGQGREAEAKGGNLGFTHGNAA